MKLINQYKTNLNDRLQLAGLATKSNISNTQYLSQILMKS